MSCYEIIKQFDNCVIDRLIERSLLNPNIKRDVRIYEHYFNELKTEKKMQALTNTADAFFVSEKTVERVIKKMR